MSRLYVLDLYARRKAQLALAKIRQREGVDGVPDHVYLEMIDTVLDICLPHIQQIDEMTPRARLEHVAREAMGGGATPPQLVSALLDELLGHPQAAARLEAETGHGYGEALLRSVLLDEAPGEPFDATARIAQVYRDFRDTAAEGT